MNDDLRIRPATNADVRLLFEWRNEEETRRMSGSSAPVSLLEHTEWFTKALSGGLPGRSIYIVENATPVPVGMVRSDEREDGYTEVSYSVAKEWRGKGLGKRMVLQFVKEHLADKKLAAKIKKGVNPASEYIARTLGLAPTEELPATNPGEPPMVEWR